MTTAGVWNSLQ